MKPRLLGCIINSILYRNKQINKQTNKLTQTHIQICKYQVLQHF